MNNQYLPKYVKVKKVMRSDGRPCFLEKDHVNPVEDTLLFEDTQFGNLVEPAGTDLVSILRHISDGSASTECKIKSISKNGTTLPIDQQKNVDIEVPTQLSQLAEDANHTTLTAEQKNSLANKVDKSTTIAGVNLQDNISKAEMLTALDNPQNNVIESVTINGNTPTVTDKNQAFTVLGNAQFPSSFVDGINPSSDAVTTLDFCRSIQNTASAIAGMTYLGKVHLSDLPFPGGTGDVIVRIMTNDKVIVLELFSGDMDCKHWYAMYYGNAMQTGDTTCPWQGIMSVNGDVNRGYSPVNNYQAAPKKYVDDSIKINAFKFNGSDVNPFNKKITIAESDPEFTAWKTGSGLAAGGDGTGAAKAYDFGVSLGVETYSRLGVAVGPNAEAGDSTIGIATAVGRHAQAKAKYSIALGGGDNATSAPIVAKGADGAVQIGIGTNNVANTLKFKGTTVVNASGKIPDDSLQTNPSTKVDKVTGKGLSTNDYTTEEKNKLASDVELVFTFADSSTKTFKFVGSEVSA